MQFYSCRSDCHRSRPSAADARAQVIFAVTYKLSEAAVANFNGRSDLIHWETQRSHNLYVSDIEPQILSSPRWPIVDGAANATA
ncbi:hypothetical protein EVAR_71022_1 [Eumeta japonica]|uniref:Uncharacterized protein n=1 Tax=Eumeta variegata TaxID=151549 RepID=A0A4C2ABI5_EUMVA|nr:hypothetical protein EVAR_71022_1 [Eumeta japonica]